MKPYIVRFENQVSPQEFDVVVNHPDCSVATEWTKGYFNSFGYNIKYLHSDFEGNHTYRRSK